MDIYLKKRWDLIPNLVETVKGFATQEKELLENITDIKTSFLNRFSFRYILYKVYIKNIID